MDEMRCAKCCKIKPAGEFNPTERRRRSPGCKECQAMAWRLKHSPRRDQHQAELEAGNPMPYRSYGHSKNRRPFPRGSYEHLPQYRKGPRGSVDTRAQKREWTRANPEKRVAHKAVEAAILAGRLKPQPCERCGHAIGIHAHHDDYSKPLDVSWLCPRHHLERHRELRALSKKEAA